jgi:hypothetical protein
MSMKVIEATVPLDGRKDLDATGIAAAPELANLLSELWTAVACCDEERQPTLPISKV